MWPNPQFLRSWSQLLKKSLMENFIFCAVFHIIFFGKFWKYSMYVYLNQFFWLQVEEGISHCLWRFLLYVLNFLGLNVRIIDGSAENTVISSNFLVWKFCGKAQFPPSCWQIARNYVEMVHFRKISTPGN